MYEKPLETLYFCENPARSFHLYFKRNYSGVKSTGDWFLQLL